MCEEANDENEKPPQIPGVDFVVSRDLLDAVKINQAITEVASVECLDVHRRLVELDGETPDEQSDAIRLLAGLTNYHFVPDHPTEPFKPMSVMGDRRSLVPTDLKTQQIDVIAEFAPTVDHLGLRARLSDVSWFIQRKRQDMAEMAIASYCDSVEAVRAGNATFSFENGSAWSIGAKEALVRAANISRTTHWKLPTSQRVRDLIADLVATANHDEREEDFWRLANLDLDHEITPPADMAAMATVLAGNKLMAKKPDARRRLLELAARAHRCGGDNESTIRCMVEAAECHVQQANIATSPMMEGASLQSAIQMLRNYPNTRERREALSARLRTVQPKILDEMGQFSTEIDLSEIVERSVASVRGHSWPTAFLSLVLCDLVPPPDELRQEALKHAQEYPLQGIMPMQVHDFQGRVVFQAPGIGSDSDANERHLRFKMAFNRGHARQVRVAGAINPIRRTLSMEHPVSSETVLELLRGSPFIPPGHEYIYARAVCSFLGGEDIEAVTLLVPQLENSLRHVLFLNGYDTTITDADGIQTEASLSIMLNPAKRWRAALEQAIPERYIHEIDLLLNFAGGPSVRNQVAHGKVPAGRFWDHNFTYAAWLIIHLATLPLADRWGDIEEVFARVTGLHRGS